MHIGTLPLTSTHSNSAANHRFYDSRIPNPGSYDSPIPIPDSQSRFPIPGPQPRIASTVISSRS
ncbi:hypothetical protein FHY11_001692 [Xanthomonas arboricola]|nr:hypothetical protein [Xanthomonas euroxanthea]